MSERGEPVLSELLVEATMGARSGHQSTGSGIELGARAPSNPGPEGIPVAKQPKAGLELP